MSQSSINYIEVTLVLELLTPLHIGSGEAAGGSDAGIVRDFNGLPGIPGTSMQGMLRSACEEALGERFTDRIFGVSGTSNRGTGRGGRLWVGWGVVHASDNKPASVRRDPLEQLAIRRLPPAERDGDPVLRDAAQPMLRDHVCLNGRGVADGRAKFDELVISAGHRFTVKLRLATATGDKQAAADGTDDWRILKRVLRSPHLRLGGKTRRGLGAFEIIGWKETGESTSISDDLLIADSLKFPKIDESFSRELVSESLWMFGGGFSDDADSAPVSGKRIVWDDATNQGSVEAVWIIPGSAVKGALWHRTKFHANRLAKNFLDGIGDLEKEQKTKDVENWMTEIFGAIQGDGGMPGKVYINDIFVPIQLNEEGSADFGRDLATVQTHVAINPFTAGAKDSALFNDQPLKPLAAPIRIDVQLNGTVSEKAKNAFNAAIDDLAAGRLALGAHAGRGYGTFLEASIQNS